MDKITIYGILVASLAVAWFAVWNHYNVILIAKGVKPTKWRGDDTIFLFAALTGFIFFSVLFFIY